MPRQSTPTLARRRLGAALRELRDAAGLTRETVGEALDCSGSKISRIEGGDVGVRRGDLLTMLDLYGLTDEDRRQAFVDLARKSKERDGWWLKYSRLPNPYLRLIQLETVASAIHNFQLIVVPGLLQTEDYARAVIRAHRPDDSPDEIERHVKVRRERQDLLRGDDAPELWAVLDEAALLRTIGGPAVMTQQLRWLAEINDHPRVNVQILPFDHGGHQATTGAFAILRFDDPADPDVVYVEGFAGDVYLDSAEDAQRATLVFDRLRADALSSTKSTEMITTVARRYARE